jgi:hypothetical protein
MSLPHICGGWCDAAASHARNSRLSRAFASCLASHRLQAMAVARSELDGLTADASIAAGAFAQSLLELPCHPKGLDLVAAEMFSRKPNQ